MVFCKLVASDEATTGVKRVITLVEDSYSPPNSVMEKLLRISPCNRGTRYFFFCSGVPNRASTSDWH